MEEETGSAHAKVQVTIEINVGSKWGKDCTVEQIYKQAKDSASMTLNRVIDKIPEITLASKMKVNAIIVPSED